MDMIAIVLLHTCIFSAYESHVELPQWILPAATCPEIVEFLSEKCHNRPRAWIPFMFANRIGTDTLQCVQCRQRHRVQSVCEHDPFTLWPLLLFDTRTCTNQTLNAKVSGQVLLDDRTTA